MDLNFLKNLVKPAKTKIILLIMDGLGGLPREPGGKTELESASTPNLDALTANGICGLHQPVGYGIAPGSGPAHLGVFGYDPTQYVVGRGALAAVGIGFDLQATDVAARGNFCTLGGDGKVTDRRAGRISTETNQELCAILSEIKIPGVEVFVDTVKEHRFLIVLRGKGLSGDISSTDPNTEGLAPLQPTATTAGAAGEKTVGLLKKWIAEAEKKLAGHAPANGLLLRGFAVKPNWPQMNQVYGVKAAAVAAYPMYRGVASLVGMEAIPVHDSVEEEFATVVEHWNEYDFFYVHIKRIDSFGEDGNWEGKTGLIEEVDRNLPTLLNLKPDVLCVTGDHSTPCVMKSHSWHPVPVLLSSPLCRPDPVQSFGETACLAGGLGSRIGAPNLMPIILSHASRLDKYGA